MKNIPQSMRLIFGVAALSLLSPVAQSATIFQAPNSTYAAWEAEDTFSIVNGSPTRWEVKSDATGSGNRALYAAGSNGTAAPASFASFAIRFRAAGDYTLYFRWRADKSFTDLDPNSANSYYRPNSFGNLGPDVANYGVSAVNNSRTPPSVNNYAVGSETQTYSVTQAQVDAGVPLILKFGTREAGMFIDRVVLSLNPLTEAEFNALPNSDTDVIPQGANESFVAFEAERVSVIVNGSPTRWEVKNDATASGNQALFAAGSNGTAAPASFASFAIRFRAAGDYTLYFRWRADKSFTDLDPNSANSYYRPNSLGDLGPDVANYGVSAVNNSRTPPSVNNYAVGSETQTYTVTQAQVDAGVPLILKFGTREAGMFIDRVALSLNPLTEAEFNALPNSGSVARPGLVKAVGSASLTSVRVTFDRPLSAGSVTAQRFTLSGGVNVSDAVLDPNTSRDVILTTSAQAQNIRYTVTVNGVTDVNGNPVASNSEISFTSWKNAAGWITRELYHNVTGGTVIDLQNAANFPDNPNSVEFVRSVSIGADLQAANFGARFRGWFIPPQPGAYEFYLFADDDALLSISLDDSPANLSPVLQVAGPSQSFDPAVVYVSDTLVAGRNYLFEVLYAQNTASASLGLAARRVGTQGNVADLPLLGGNAVSTFVNPDAGAVQIIAQPGSVTVPAGNRVRLRVIAAAPLGGTLFYQWQLNGNNIPGATRPTYVTPVLAASDDGNKYRCMISVNGADVPSADATVTVGPAEPARLLPYIGINFASGEGAGTTVGAALAPNDVAGAVLQENFNNLFGTNIDDTQVLVDASGQATPVTIAVYDPATESIVPAAVNIGTGTGSANTSADHLLMQGSLANNNLPLTLRLSGVPPGNYALIVYSVGFNFNSTYEEDFALAGGETYPTLTVRGQVSTDFIADPTLVRMSSTNPANRDHGNYVMFENVSPAANGTFLLTVTPQSTTIGNTAYFPPVNGLQLVKVNPVANRPSLTVARQGASFTISWTSDAAGFLLEASSALGVSASWRTVSGVPNPLPGAGSTTIAPASASQFFRLRK
jgi:hypothetical protein